MKHTKLFALALLSTSLLSTACDLQTIQRMAGLEIDGEICAEPNPDDCDPVPKQADVPIRDRD